MREKWFLLSPKDEGHGSLNQHSFQNPLCVFSYSFMVNIGDDELEALL